MREHMGNGADYTGRQAGDEINRRPTLVSAVSVEPESNLFNLAY
jgi:hypothetical protein